MRGSFARSPRLRGRAHLRRADNPAGGHNVAAPGCIEARSRVAPPPSNVSLCERPVIPRCRDSDLVIKGGSPPLRRGSLAPCLSYSRARPIKGRVVFYPGHPYCPGQNLHPYTLDRPHASRYSFPSQIITASARAAPHPHISLSSSSPLSSSSCCLRTRRASAHIPV